MAEPYSWKRAIQYLEKNIVILFVGGTGNPYFSTDSAAALRALEIKAELLLKATKVDGVYDKDPIKHPNAKKFERITYAEVIAKRLQVMDSTAIALCWENKIPIQVFNLFEHSLKSVLFNEKLGTLVVGESL